MMMTWKWNYNIESLRTVLVGSIGNILLFVCVSDFWWGSLQNTVIWQVKTDTAKLY